MRSKIAAAVDRGPDTAVIADPATASASALARSGVRCVTFESERYCLYFGWTHRTKKELVRHVAETAQSETGTADNGTGGTSLLQTLRAHAALPREQQAAAETKQFESAATGLAKLVELRHEVEGKPIPAGFYDRHWPAAVISDSGPS